MLSLPYKNIASPEEVRHWLLSHRKVVAVHDTLNCVVLIEKAEHRTALYDYLTGRTNLAGEDMKEAIDEIQG